jgi:hypothetical protein
LQIKTAKQKYEKKQGIASSKQEYEEIIADDEIVFSDCTDFCHSDHGQQWLLSEHHPHGASEKFHFERFDPGY